MIRILSLGPTEGTPEHHTLQTKFGFSYRTLLGELLYAYVTTRPDLGYAITTLAKFSSTPGEVHYTYLKRLVRYVRTTCSWGILYWTRTPRQTLSLGEHVPPILDKISSFFPSIPEPWRLYAFIDAAHANDLRNRRFKLAMVLCMLVVSLSTVPRHSLSLLPAPPKLNSSPQFLQPK